MILKLFWTVMNIDKINPTFLWLLFYDYISITNTQYTTLGTWENLSCLMIKNNANSVKLFTGMDYIMFNIWKMSIILLRLLEIMLFNILHNTYASVHTCTEDAKGTGL